MASYNSDSPPDHSPTFNNNSDDTMPDQHMSVGRYLATRLPTLKPPMAKAPNPFKLLALLNTQQWLFFLVAFIAWSWDAFDFFTVSLTVSQLAEEFGKKPSEITWGITLVLMFRALFGIAMGGLYGNAAATALEDCPEAARGILSGMLQQGYAFGYLLATVFARALVDTTPHGWRPLFWFGACPPVLIIIFRLCLPETKSYVEREAVRKASGSVASSFVAEGKVALKKHWLLLIYLVLLMAGFNFMSHGSQDLYPQMLENQFNFSPNAVTVTQVVANLGAMTGGTVIGYSSQIFGRRFSIIIMSIIGAALLYPYGFTPSHRIIAAAFFEQFCVQGAWGVIPIHLMELSPGAFRTFVVGTSYQLGNLVSSASSTIESTIGERFPLPPRGDTKRYQYGRVIAIFMACVYVYVILLAIVGPERRGRRFGVEFDEDVKGVIVVGGGGEGKKERDSSSDVEMGRKGEAVG
ncbi:MAG: hypothetical protein LQ348_006978 [Seirophora lacunosa]|nr:MAG: hypothetical protein LQ348_006978 [Seirophora lacunosa]